MTQGVQPGRRRANSRSPVENALRYIGGQRGGQLGALLEAAVTWQGGDVGIALEPLIGLMEIPEGWTPAQQATVLEHLIKDGVQHPVFGPSEHSRERRVLRAAFRLADPDIQEPWASTLTERWEQLKTLDALFPHASTTQPMEAAWTRAVRRLAEYLSQQIAELNASSGWTRYNAAPEACAVLRRPTDLRFRPASPGAQPFVIDRLVTTVFFRERVAVRRITERVVTAKVNGVEFFTAMAFSGRDASSREFVPVRALWGCQAEVVPSSQPNEPLVTRLRFPRPLRVGEQANFASEAIFPMESDYAIDYDWTDISIDHHGIVPGELYHGGAFPLSGLTIQVRFDVDCLPIAAWWYAEATEWERITEPPATDRHVPIRAGEAAHTFVGIACEPRESYGLGWRWPPAA